MPLAHANRVFCCRECQKKSWEKECRWCGKMFVPKEQRVIFCSRSCGGMWKHSQPEIVARMIAGKDLKAMGHAISKTIMANPLERKRRSLLAKKCLKEFSKKGWIGCGFGGKHGPTRAEAIILNLFPESKNNFVVPTGESAKLGNTQLYRIDVAWPNIKLAVESDGGYHKKLEQQQNDRKKDAFLRDHGWTVLRFWNKEVILDTTRIREVIESTISKLKDTHLLV